MKKDYATEAGECWGHTAAYHEHTKKTKHYTKEKWTEVNNGLMAIFAEFAMCKNNGNCAASDKTQLLVKKLQAYITEYYYTCTNEILTGLGKMYIADERFKKNIDKYGIGTAAFAADAIGIYTKDYYEPIS